jgi:hypothetical protein
MKTLMISAFAAVMALGNAAVTCPTDAGGVQVTTNQGCICPSGKVLSGGNCVANSVCIPGTAFPATVNTTFNSDGMSLTTIDMSGYDSDVTLSLAVPGMAKLSAMVAY